jgi:hypothetical protein
VTSPVNVNGAARLYSFVHSDRNAVRYYMKLLALLAVPAFGLMCVFYALRGKSILRKGDRAAGGERAITVVGGLLLIACGLIFGFLVFRLFSNR